MRLLTKGIFCYNEQKTLLRIMEKMILCKFCESSDIFKSGFARGFQRYKCKDCGKNFTLTPPRGVPEKEKFKALVLYASGLSMNRIAQLFGVSTVAVLKWIRTLETKLCMKFEPSPNDKVIVMEVDEFWYYLKKRSKKFAFLKPMIVIENDALIGNLVIVFMPHSKNALTD